MLLFTVDEKLNPESFVLMDWWEFFCLCGAEHCKKKLKANKWKAWIKETQADCSPTTLEGEQTI